MAPSPADDWAVIVTHRTGRSTAPHEQETTRTDLFIRSLWLNTIDRLGAVINDDGSLLFFLLIVFNGDHSIFQDGVKVGLNIVFVDEVVIVVLIFF
ncbi:MAG: hypothetical protein CL410_10070 [Acidimicrobiaceae bacterium]|nr:hypothetical protein [Acidimicrobiaceae bacterium]